MTKVFLYINLVSKIYSYPSSVNMKYYLKEKGKVMLKGIKGIHHIGISVPDLKAAEHFYCEVLGLELVVRWDFEASGIGDQVMGLKNGAAKTLMINAGNIYLELFEFESPKPNEQGPSRPVCDHGYTHLAFEVDGDIQEVFDRLEKEGVKWHAPLQDDTDETEELTLTYGRDPFGNVIEIQKVSKSSSFNVNKLPRWAP
jgi:glyoxylase I family protein